jgi:hypothetical protein
MTTPSWILTSEADFIAAEQEIASLRSGRAKEWGKPDDVDNCYTAIATAPPPTMAAAIIKLRFLVDPDLGFDEGASADRDLASLRQVVAFLAGWQSADGEARAQWRATIAKGSADDANVRITLEDELLKIEGVTNCLEAIVGDNAGSNEYRYLAHRLQDHFHAAYRAFEELTSSKAGGAA